MDSSLLLDVNQSQRPSTKPKQITIPLPLSPHVDLHIQITHDGTSILAFITTTESSNAVALSSLGSFVYAMPNVRGLVFANIPIVIFRCVDGSNPKQRLQPNEPLSTVLYSIPTSVDFATRTAKIVARRTEKPTYIGCSVELGSSTVEEELAALKAAIDGVLSIIGDKPNEGNPWQIKKSRLSLRTNLGLELYQKPINWRDWVVIRPALMFDHLVKLWVAKEKGDPSATDSLD